MPNMEWTTWVDWAQFLKMLLVPGCILIASLTAGIMLNRAIKKQVTGHLMTDETTWQHICINALQGVPVSLCLVVGLYWIVNTINIIEPLVKIFSYILFTVIIFSITRVIARTVNGLIDMQIERSQEKMPKTTLLNAIVNGIIYAMGILVVLQYYGISIAPILTALGVGGMAVALSLQETLANIFSGLHLILSKQLRLGDYIRLSTGEEGRVTDITWRFTTIQSTAGNDIIVPNQKIASAILTNYNRPVAEVSISIGVGVSYDSDLDRVEQITLEVAREVMEKIDPGNSFDPSVRFHTFAASSINFNVNLRTHQFMNQYLLKHEFIKALTARYRQEGICIPYPIQTILQPEDAGKKIF